MTQIMTCQVNQIAVIKTDEMTQNRITTAKHCKKRRELNIL